VPAVVVHSLVGCRIYRGSIGPGVHASVLLGADNAAAAAMLASWQLKNTDAHLAALPNR